MHGWFGRWRGAPVATLTGCGLVLAAVALGGFAQSGDTIDDAQLSAGRLTLARFDEHAFSEPAPFLTYKERQRFMRGRVHFNQRWVQAPSIGGDWGLGPTFITNKCSNCHIGGGRGAPPERADEAPIALLARLSLPGVGAHGEPLPHPVYGDQIQNFGLMGQDRDDTFLGDRVPPEIDWFVDWVVVRTETLADGTTVELRQPKLRVAKAWFGPLGDDTQVSLRITQPIFGLGLLEAIPDSALDAIAQQQAEHGMQGRRNRVRDDIGKTTAFGRFGWKANQPSIRQQIAAAFAGDLGVTSSLYIEMNCPPAQVDCAEQPPGNQPELIDSNWDELVFWTQALAVPARRNTGDPRFARGETLFAQAKCAVCHVPELVTGSYPALPSLEGQRVRAYTDLMLHDMGPGLADGRPDFLASPQDWRTPPLWGLGLSKTVSKTTAMLHDGRARDATEAILWHGGEATPSREAFRRLPKADRDALLFFLDSI
jgi:CxxC motif-containing protein (DUF1111 family)